jgi:hypothetical protein
VHPLKNNLENAIFSLFNFKVFILYPFISLPKENQNKKKQKAKQKLIWVANVTSATRLLLP